MGRYTVCVPPLRAIEHHIQARSKKIPFNGTGGCSRPTTSPLTRPRSAGKVAANIPIESEASMLLENPTIREAIARQSVVD